MLALKLAAGERIYVGDDGSFIELARIGGRHAVIACDFPRDVTLLRGVLWDKSHPQSETPEPSGEPTDQEPPPSIGRGVGCAREQNEV